MSWRLLSPAILLTLTVQLHAQQLPTAPGKPTGSGATDNIKSLLDKRAGQLNKAAELKRIQAKEPGSTVRAQKTLVKSGTAPVEFPKTWKEISASRAKIAGHRLSKKEAALLKALDTTLKVDFQKMGFRDVLKYLSEKSGAGILVHEATLEEADVGYDSPVTLKVAAPQPMHAILRRILRERGLSYVVKDETIQVVTAERARDMMIVRVHEVMDLCGPIPPNGSLDYSTNRNAMHLKRIIENFIEPLLWDVNGGPAVIHYAWFNVTFTIRAPAELHLRMGAAAYGTNGK